MSAIKTPGFLDYFTYISMQKGGTALELADRWILENFSEVNPNTAKFSELVQVLGEFKSKNALIEPVMPLEYDGFYFTFVDQSGSFYWQMSKSTQKNMGEGLKVGVLNCYRAAPSNSQQFQTIGELAPKLNFYHAEILAKHLMSFFTGSSALTTP